MCLIISGNQERPKGDTTVYKHYWLREGRFYSPYRFVKYEAPELAPGQVVDSTRPVAGLNESELDDLEIDLGLHAFTSLETAKMALTRYDTSYDYNFYDAYEKYIFEMVGAPEDFVARGKFAKLDSIVFKKLKVVKIYKASGAFDRAEL
jgi:hypothetical protein